MQIPTKSQLEMLRKKYPAGARIELTKDLDDPYTVIPAGSRGTVRAVYDIGTILMSWDCGSSLGLIWGVDSFRCILPTKSQLEMLRKQFPSGARVELTKDLDNPYYAVIPAGSRGTVRAVDGVGTILVAWDCGFSLGLFWDVDSFHRIPTDAEQAAMCGAFAEVPRIPLN